MVWLGNDGGTVRLLGLVVVALGSKIMIMIKVLFR